MRFQLRVEEGFLKMLGSAIGGGIQRQQQRQQQRQEERRRRVLDPADAIDP